MQHTIEIRHQNGVFKPVSDVYQTFRMVKRRDHMHRILEAPAMLRSLDIPKYASIMEIGCGSGLAFNSIIRICKPIRMVGVDIEMDMLEKAVKKQDLVVELYQQDVRDLEFADKSFDVIIDFGTCYHIRKRPMALSEISRVLRPGGLLLYETKINQYLSHPFRFSGVKLPWHLVPELKKHQEMVLWSSRVKQV